MLRKAITLAEIQPITPPTPGETKSIALSTTQEPVTQESTPTPSSQTKLGWKIYTGTCFEVQYPENISILVQIIKQLPIGYDVNYTVVKPISSVQISKLGK